MGTRIDTVESFPKAPMESRVYQAFSKYQGMCNGSVKQEHNVPSIAWIDLGIEGNLSDEETARKFWEAASIRVWLDGKEIRHANRCIIGPYPYHMELSEYNVDGYAMRLAMVVPPLDIGDHRVDWKLELDREVWDRDTVYEAGATWNLSSLLHVG